MFWDKKEDKRSLPDLPPLKHPLTFRSEENELDFDDGEEIHELPSFPDNLNDKGFSQAAIKGAVSGPLTVEEDGEKVPEFGSAGGGDKGFRTVEMEEWKPEGSLGNEGENHFSGSAVPEPPIDEADLRVRDVRKIRDPVGGKNRDVFVKLDKFYSARKTLIDVQENLEDIDSLLKKIRDIKMREEQELGGWEKELEAIKSRVNDVNMNLFEKVD